MIPTPIVYVVDDDNAIRDSLEMYLQLNGLSVRTFPSAESFLEVGDIDRSGLLVLDLQMPKMNGYELLRELRKQQIPIPTIIICAHNVEESLPDLSPFKNVFAVFLKPFSVEKLMEVIGCDRTKSGDVNSGFPRFYN